MYNWKLQSVTERSHVCCSFRSSFILSRYVKTTEPIQFSCDCKKQTQNLLRFKEKERKCNGKNSQSPLVHITNYWSQHELKGNRHEMQSLKQKKECSAWGQTMQRDGSPRVNERRSYIFRFYTKKVTFAKSLPQDLRQEEISSLINSGFSFESALFKN